MNRLYVYQCIKDEPKNKSFGLHPTKKYKKGDYLTFEGCPTKDLQKAFIDSSEEHHLEHEHLKDYFKVCEVKIIKL